MRLNKEIQDLLLAALKRDLQHRSVIRAFAGAGMSMPSLWLIEKLVERKEAAGHDRL